MNQTGYGKKWHNLILPQYFLGGNTHHRTAKIQAKI
jgi:hypothetical protein